MTAASKPTYEQLAEENYRINREPRVGLATTRHLLEELKARGEFEQGYIELGTDMALGAANLLEVLPGSMLDYRPNTPEDIR